MSYTFIIGCARSGTSILGELIASHPEVKYIFEASDIWELGGMGENQSHRLMAHHATEPVKQQIRTWFDNHSSGAKVVVEKNPRNSLRIPYVKEIFPEAKFIHIVRDGRDVACSLIPGCGGVEWRHLKPPSWQEYYTKYSGAVRCAHVWKQVLEIVLDDLPQVPYLQIRYEDLLTAPLPVAKSIFDFLGIDFHTHAVNFCSKIANDTSSFHHAKYQQQWYQNNHSKRIGRWQENLNNEEQKIINEMLEPLLTKLGYEDKLASDDFKVEFLGQKHVGGNIDNHDKRLIVVLGMHRSGTSAVTRGLQALGVELGNNFLPPQEDNIKGFWEDADLNALNIEMLNLLKSDWHYLSPILPADVSTLYKNGYFERATKILKDKTSEFDIFGFKDPRVAKLLPFWKDVFNRSQLNVSYVLVIRNPLSVCKSLEKRHNFGFEKSALLWLEHVLSSLTGTSGENRVLVDYDRLILSPEREMHRIARDLRLHIEPLKAEKFKNEFLDEGLRHTVYQLQDLILEDSILPLVQEMYSTLVDVAADKPQLEDEVIQHRITQWQTEFSRLRATLVFIDKLNSELETMKTSQDTQMQALTAQIAERDTRIQALTVQLNEIMISKAWRAALLMRRISNFLRLRSNQP